MGNVGNLDIRVQKAHFHEYYDHIEPEGAATMRPLLHAIQDEAFVQQFKVGLSAREFSTERIERLTTLLQSVTRAAAYDPMTITELKANPGRVIESLTQSRAQRIADGKQRDREDVIMVSAEDMKILVDAILRTTLPRYPLGREIYKRVAHSGAASQVALNPPGERPHQTPSYAEALHGNDVSAENERGLAQSW
jgi:hypothetical protein